MFLLRLYRFYLSILIGAIVYFVAIRSWWAWLLTAALFRTIWLIIEKQIHRMLINKWFQQHEYDFKQLCGPYGIRLINQAETDYSIKESLAEVFQPNIKKVKQATEQLEMMDTLFKAGLRPEGDQYQLHDLKLKYGKHRLEKPLS